MYSAASDWECVHATASPDVTFGDMLVESAGCSILLFHSIVEG